MRRKRRAEAGCLDDRSREGFHQHGPRGYFVDASRLEIKQSPFVEIADSRAVAALHFIGKNLKLRFGVNGCLRAQKQILIELMRIRAIGARANGHLTEEDAMRAVLDDGGLTARCLMIDEGREGGLLIAAKEVGAVYGNAGCLSGGRHVDILPRKPCAYGEDKVLIGFSNRDARQRKMDRVFSLVLDFDVPDRGNSANTGGGHGVRPASSRQPRFR